VAIAATTQTGDHDVRRDGHGRHRPVGEHQCLKPFGPNDLALDGSGITALFPGEVVTRALVRDVEPLVEEIRLMLDEGVVAAPEDIDLCMILGAGWPFHLGGITPYLDRAGIAEKVTGTRFRV
jgi:hypothetical protein